MAPATGPLVIYAEDMLELPAGLRVWFVPPPATVRESVLLSVRRGPKGPLMRFQGVDDIGTASSLAGATVMVKPEDLPEELLTEEEDLLGYEVFDEERGELGTIEEVIVTGANDVWIVRGPLGEVLVPDIDDVVLEVDDEARRIDVRMLPGLIED